MSVYEFIITWLTHPFVMITIVVGLLYVLSNMVDKEVEEEIKLPTLEYQQLPPTYQLPRQEEIGESDAIEGNNEDIEPDDQFNEQKELENSINDTDLDSQLLRERLMYVSQKKQQEELNNKEREMAEREEAFDIKQQKDDIEREKENIKMQKQKQSVFNESQDAAMARQSAEQKLKEANFRNKEADAKEREAKRKMDAYNEGRYW